MKHELGTKTTKTGVVRQLAVCAGCGKKEPRDGRLGLPHGWLGFSNPLFGKPWVVEVCSWNCEHAALMDAVQAALREGATDEQFRSSDSSDNSPRGVPTS